MQQIAASNVSKCLFLILPKLFLRDFEIWIVPLNSINIKNYKKRLRKTQENLKSVNFTIDKTFA